MVFQAVPFLGPLVSKNSETGTCDWDIMDTWALTRENRGQPAVLLVGPNDHATKLVVG